MKLIKYSFYLLVLLLLSCQDEMEHATVSSLRITVKMPAEIKDGIKFSHRQVTLRSERMVYTAETDDNGVAEFKDIIPDSYNVYTSWELTGEEYIALSKNIVEKRPALISATKAKMLVLEASGIELPTVLSVKQSLLISKVYAAGTKDINNSNYASDPYVEIFNNSDEAQYVDGLYLALVEGDSPMAFPASLNTDSLHVRQVYRFPGTGKEHAIQPGKSIVLALSARNHIELAPTSVDLHDADFEFKGTRYPNNSAVTGMTLIYTTYVGIPEINLQRNGINSLCLFSTNDIVANYPIIYPKGKTSGNRFMAIPANLVMDGVELLPYKNTGVDINSKRLQNFIDAGYMNISSTGGANHESIERRVDTQKSGAGRIYLIDTNNSQNDFKCVTDPTPRKYDKALLLE